MLTFTGMNSYFLSKNVTLYLDSSYYFRERKDNFLSLKELLCFGNPNSKYKHKFLG